MSVEIIVPEIGTVEIQQFSYSDGRVGYIARTPDTKKGDSFNLTINDKKYPDTVAFKEYDYPAQLINRFLTTRKELFRVFHKGEIGFNLVMYCRPMKKGWAK